MAQTPLPILVVAVLPLVQGGGLLQEVVARGGLHVLPKANLASDDAAGALLAQVSELGSARVALTSGSSNIAPRRSFRGRVRSS